MRGRTARRRRSKPRTRRQRGGGGRVYVMYHIFCNQHTKQIVKEQIAAIQLSGLYKRVDKIYCFLVGAKSHIDSVESLLKDAGNKYEIKATGPEDTSYERFTLLKIHDLIHPDDKFLYLHSKGVTRPEEDIIYWWVLYMSQLLMCNVEQHLKDLDQFDILGPGYVENVPGKNEKMVGPHFSGNFWWSTGKYYKTLPKTIGTHYNDPELYIFSGSPKFKILDDGRHPRQHNFYYSPIPARLYIDSI